MSRIIGIDFGSTNTTVAYADGNEITIIPDENGNESFPSMVSIKEDGEFLVGHDAQKRLLLHPEETFFGIKRLLGSKPDKKGIENHPEIVCKDDSICAIVNGKEYSLELISAAILKKAKGIAEVYFDEEIDEAIVTVPAYFGISQRHAVKKAGEMAGLNIKRIISEPTAAAVAYGMLASETKEVYQDKIIKVDGKLKAERHVIKNKEVKVDGKIMVIDFGGGTLDVSILEIGDGVYEVISTCGNTKLGGEDFDSAIAKYIISDIAKKYGRCLQDNSSTRRRILEAAKTAKEDLSSCKTIEINIPYLLKTKDGLSNYTCALSQEDLREIVAELLDEMGEPIEQAISDARMDKKDIDKVVLVGGLTRMPIIREVIKEYFGKEPFYGINPNTAVAIGAAIQAGVLAHDIKDVLLMDVTPLTLSVETKDGLVSPILERNTTFPTFKKETFTTTDKKFTGVNIHIVQGEQKYAKDNETVGYITIDDLNPKLKEDQKIEVTFNIDANGELSVSAENKNTHKKVSIVTDGNIETNQKVEYTNDDDKKADKTPAGKTHWWNKK